jgi:hypothetical protein
VIFLFLEEQFFLNGAEMSARRLGTKRSRVFSSDEDEEENLGLENVSKRANINSGRNSEDFRGVSSLNQTKDKSLKSLFESRVLEKTLRESGLEPDFSHDVTKSHVLVSDQVSLFLKLFLRHCLSGKSYVV